MSHCHGTVLLGHDGLIFSINLTKHVNLMMVHLLIYLMPTISVNIQALKCIFKSEQYFKSPKILIHLSPFVGLPLLFEPAMSTNCSVCQAYFRSGFLLFLSIPAILIVFQFTLLPHFALGFACASPSLEPSSYLFHWIATLVLLVSVYNY